MTVKEKLQQFRAWQQRPFEVAPLSQEEHDCATCGTHFQGNYCPRCGQSARIRRYSFKSALLLFFDVWGLGNRGMFRTLRDLLLRPGYMIRDYLSGMQMAYFPPFKMLFLLTTLSIIISHGLNISGQVEKPESEDLKTEINIKTDKNNPTASARSLKAKKRGRYLVAKAFEISERFPNALSILVTLLLTSFLYLFFHRAKAIPDLRFSEFFIAMVFSMNMVSLFDILLSFLCLKSGALSLATMFMVVVPLKQLSGFSWMRTIVSYVLACMMLFVFLVSMVVLTLYLVYIL